jgi:ABC-2 type transport system ATP-binding protein
MSTHSLEVAEEMCDRIAIINLGEIIACGTMEELRAMSDSTDRLEAIFLKLTGGEDAADIMKVLRD